MIMSKQETKIINNNVKVDTRYVLWSDMCSHTGKIYQVVTQNDMNRYMNIYWQSNGKMIQEQIHMKWNRIALWSSLHELARIYRLSYGSVFESPLCRVHNEHESGSPVTEFGSHEWVQNDNNMVTCGTPTEAPTEGTDAAEDIDG